MLRELGRPIEERFCSLQRSGKCEDEARIRQTRQTDKRAGQIEKRAGEDGKNANHDVDRACICVRDLDRVSQVESKLTMI